MHFIERCRTLEYAPRNKFFALRQYGHGPVAEIPIAPADHLVQFLGILPKHRRRGHHLAKTPFSGRCIRWAPSLRPSDTNYSISCPLRWAWGQNAHWRWQVPLLERAAATWCLVQHRKQHRENTTARLTKFFAACRFLETCCDDLALQGTTELRKLARC